MNSARFRLGAAAAILATMAIPEVAAAESFAMTTHGTPAGGAYGTDMPSPEAARLAGRHFPRGRSRAGAGTAQAGFEPRVSKALEFEPDGSSDVGLADAKVDWSSLAPYVGMGFGNSMNDGRWSFAFDLGVMFTGLLDLAKSGTAHLEVREQFNPEDPFSDVKYYPVLSLGLAYRF